MYATLNLHLQLYKMHRGNTDINVWLQKLSIPPPWKEFFLRSHHLSGNSSQASYIYLTFWAFENPQPPGISNPFSGGSMDVFWIYKIHNYIEILSYPQIQLCLSGTGPQSQRPVVKLRGCPWGIAVVSIQLKICCLCSKQLKKH